MLRCLQEHGDCTLGVLPRDEADAAALAEQTEPCEERVGKEPPDAAEQTQHAHFCTLSHHTC